MRAIDADAFLKDGLKCKQGIQENGLVYVPLRDVIESIKNAPTVAVPAIALRKKHKRRTFGQARSE